MDYSGLLGGGGQEIDWDAILRKVLQGDTQDTHSPLSAGLMTAGLAMMAGGRGKSLVETLGSGGLLGLQAATQERERVKKDPTQQIALANAITQLQGTMQDRAMLKDIFKPQGAQGPQAPEFVPAQGLPGRLEGFGMFDRGMTGTDFATGKPTGLSGYLGSMQTPQQGGGFPNLTQEQAFRLGMSKTPAYAEMGRFALKEMNDLQKVGPQEGVYGVNKLNPNQPPRQLVAPGPKLPEGVTIGPGGQAQMVENLDKVIAQISEATAAGTARGKAPYEQATLPTTGGGSIDTNAMIAYYARQHNVPPAIVREVINNPQIKPDQWGSVIQHIKSVTGIGTVPGAGVQVAPGGAITGEQPGQGPAAPGQGGGELYRTPSPADTKVAEAKGVQPYELERSLAGHAYTAQMADLKESYKVANAARAMLESINESRSALTDPVIVGGFAKGKIEGLNMVNGLLPAKYQISPDLLGNSQRLASSLGGALVAHATDLGSQPSNADAKRLEKVIGDEGLSEKGIRAILDFQEKMARQVVDRHNRIAKQAAGKGASPLFDYTVEAPEAFKPPAAPQAAPGAPQAAPVAPSFKPPTVTGMTRDVAINELWTKGNDADREALRKRGLVPKGIAP
jgi:hypothetical protein